MNKSSVLLYIKHTVNAIVFPYKHKSVLWCGRLLRFKSLLIFRAVFLSISSSSPRDCLFKNSNSTSRFGISSFSRVRSYTRRVCLSNFLIIIKTKKACQWSTGCLNALKALICVCAFSLSVRKFAGESWEISGKSKSNFKWA